MNEHLTEPPLTAESRSESAPLTIEHLRAWHDGDEVPPLEMGAAYDFVDSVIEHALSDSSGGYVWHGWVLRWAYLAGVKAERERAALICEQKAEGIERVNTYRDRVNAPSQWGADMVRDCATAIRGVANVQPPQDSPLSEA
jgi:hypothetical protein